MKFGLFFIFRPWFVVLSVSAAARGQILHGSSAASQTRIPNDSIQTIREEIGVSDILMSPDARQATSKTPNSGGDDGYRIHDAARNTREADNTIIVGGDKSEPGEFPYFVNAGSCGGSLIAPTVVLTAAHCHPKNRVGQNVTVGATRRDTLDNGGSFQKADEIMVLDGARHPMFERKTFLNNDFGLLLLERPYNYTGNIELVLNEDPEVPRGGEMLDVIGMGSVGYNEHHWSNELRDVSIPATTSTECGEIYKQLTDKMMCAGEVDGGKDACQGDSGAPLVKRDGNVHVQVGIVSYGKNCAKYSGVYARISKGHKWIRKQVCEKWRVRSFEICGPRLEAIPETEECIDDREFRYQDDPRKDCDWVGRRPIHRCPMKVGEEGMKRRRRIKHFCREACGKC